MADEAPADISRPTFDKEHWAADVYRTTKLGYPMLIYRHRPRRITAVLAEARRWHSRPFIIQGGRTITFEQHERMVLHIANGLQAHGVRPMDRVAIYAANSADWVATFFAVLSLGAVVVPCNGWWSAEELGHACSHGDPAIVITDDKRSTRVPRGLATATLSELLAADAPCGTYENSITRRCDEDDPALILFTAGTTGFPKGAILSHRSLVANLQTLLVTSRKLPDQLSDDVPASVAIVGLPLFHIGAIQMFLVPLVTGARLIFLEGRFDAGLVLKLIESHGATMFSGVPTMMERMLRHPDIGRRDLSSLRTVVLGGAPVGDELLASVRKALPATSRGLGRTYGLTEAGGVVSTGVGASILDHPGSVGKPAPVVEVRIDAASRDASGPILVRSPAAMDGYWGEPDDRTLDGDGWLDTGDIGHVDREGFLYVTERKKDIIIRGGENIASARVEAVLRSHPSVADAAVVGLPDTDLGQIVCAAVTLSETGELITAEDLTAYAHMRLAHFEVPARWWLRSGNLPTNAAGKIAKSQIIAEWPTES